MTYHTIIPEETLFEGWDDYRPDYLEINLNGVQLQVEMLNGTQARIVRLLSADPNDFLNPSYTPGTLIEFQPSLT